MYWLFTVTRMPRVTTEDIAENLAEPGAESNLGGRGALTIAKDDTTVGRERDEGARPGSLATARVLPPSADSCPGAAFRACTSNG